MQKRIKKKWKRVTKKIGWNRIEKDGRKGEKKKEKENVEFIKKKRRKKGKQREFTGLFKTSLDLSSFV